MGYTQQSVEKNVKEGKGNQLEFCRVFMKNFKRYPEDSWINEVDLGDGNALFAILAGHGGSSMSIKEFKQGDTSR